MPFPVQYDDQAKHFLQKRTHLAGHLGKSFWQNDPLYNAGSQDCVLYSTITLPRLLQLK